MQLIFEKSRPNRFNDIFPALDVPMVNLEENHRRKSTCYLAEVTETIISRHYTELANRTYGVNNGFYPLGSCTMKYNPKINEELAFHDKFIHAHPLSDEDDVQGCLEIYYYCEKYLCEVTGMDGMSMQAAAGSHGELAGLLMIDKYHKSNGDMKRRKILIPDSAHGTNPASAAVAGFEVINIPSTRDGFVDLKELENYLDETTAGFMITNPNTLGLFDKNIVLITEMVHKVGGLTYYDGANMNAIMGITRPGDMGFDVIHLNLHKTFSTPHGGGGPGCGPVGCKEFLIPYLLGSRVILEENKYKWKSEVLSIGRMKSFHGHFLVLVRALTYIITLGGDGLKNASLNALLNANYMKYQLKDSFDILQQGLCMHEFILSMASLKENYHVSALDFAKTLLDYGIHPPTMYFPLIVEEALMIEPTETEDRETLDKVIQILKEVIELAKEKKEGLKQSPTTMVITRPDEVNAARNPILQHQF